jgi:hypothetical protein
MATSQVGGLVVWNNTSATQVTEPTATGIVLSTAGLASFVPKGGYDPVTDFILYDDFIAGSTSSPSIGVGWSTNAGSLANTATVADHPGIQTISTTTTQNTLASANLRTNATTGIVDPAGFWDMTWIIRPQLDSTNISMKFGMNDNITSLTPSNGIYFERLGGDTSWFGVTRSGGSQTRTAALITSASNTWFKFRMRRIDASTVGFTVNALTEVTATATIPTAMLMPGWLVTNPAAAAAATVDVDLWTLRISGLTR